ncbi:MAG: hypothetical protein IPK99_01585 [Flavobacteriales bacterium]|nr:hypothetical protein [Flavobacteriales bacterium]
MANGCIGCITYLERSAQMEPWNDAPAEATVWGPEELLVVVHRRADHKA